MNLQAPYQQSQFAVALAHQQHQLVALFLQQYQLVPLNVEAVQEQLALSPCH